MRPCKCPRTQFEWGIPVTGRWLAVLLLTSASLAQAQDAPAKGASPTAAKLPDQGWIARSNEFANLLIDIEKKHSPESASSEGLSQYDELISDPTLEDQHAADA